MIRKILILHGPNLNLLGEREPHIYGSLTLDEINQNLQKLAGELNVTLRILQSNYEGTLIDRMHEFRKWADAVVINPAAFTHYSIALRDAVSAIGIPTVEVHLTNLENREEFRRVSVIAPVCIRQISGLGWKSYAEAIRYLTTL